MMNIKKTFGKAILMAMSVLALSSCGNNQDNNATNQSQSVEQENKEDSKEDKEDDSRDKTTDSSKTTDKPDTWIADREIKLLVFESAGDTGEGTMSPEIAQYIKDRTGITLTIESVSNEDSYQALAAGLSSGDLSLIHI